MFTLLNTSATTVRLSWAEPLDPNGVITSYTLRVTLAEEDAQYLDPFDDITYNARTTADLVERLHAFAEYSFELRASTVVGEGNGSPFSVTTLQAGRCVNHTLPPPPSPLPPPSPESLPAFLPVQTVCIRCFCFITVVSSAPFTGGTAVMAGVVSSLSVQLLWTPPPPSNWNGIVTAYNISKL